MTDHETDFGLLKSSIRIIFKMECMLVWPPPPASRFLSSSASFCFAEVNQQLLPYGFVSTWALKQRRSFAEKQCRVHSWKSSCKCIYREGSSLLLGKNKINKRNVGKNSSLKRFEIFIHKVLRFELEIGTFKQLASKLISVEIVCVKSVAVLMNLQKSSQCSASALSVSVSHRLGAD